LKKILSVNEVEGAALAAPAQEVSMRSLKYIYLTLGLVALVLGAVGVALPILPTTPFLLLALFFFSRGSERWNNWFRSTKLYKKHLESFVRNRAMPLSKKIVILLFADAMLALPFVYIKLLHVRILILLVVAAKYYYFIFKVKSLPRQQAEKAGELT
jgi:uncharacterized membrane protein YbaN (DUF454 family)